MARQLIKGNVAVIKGALLAGCQAFFGYPITPASEIAEGAAYYFPKMGATFLQAESEVASINMVYGAAGAGLRVMTASSSPGISLKQEGVSYIAGAELPCVIVDVMRGGPGLGNIAPEQADYNQIVKGGGHGNYRALVLAPNCAQEMCDLTMLAFDLADQYRNPVYVLADGFIGQMMEPVEFPDPVTKLPEKSWAVRGTPETADNLISSIQLEPDDLEELNNRLQEKYREMAAHEVRFQEYQCEDAEVLLIGFGIVSRVLHSAVDELRAQGIKAGLLRPITLFPFPVEPLRQYADQVREIWVMELNNGQMVDDVRLAVNGTVPVHFYGRMGGNVISTEEVIRKVQGKEVLV